MSPEEHIEKAEKHISKAARQADLNHCAASNHAAVARVHIELARYKRDDA